MKNLATSSKIWPSLSLSTQNKETRNTKKRLWVLLEFKKNIWRDVKDEISRDHLERIFDFPDFEKILLVYSLYSIDVGEILPSFFDFLYNG